MCLDVGAEFFEVEFGHYNKGEASVDRLVDETCETLEIRVNLHNLLKQWLNHT